jgi:hypothetical protein
MHLRTPADVAADLLWWDVLLEKFNGYRFFYNDNRQLFPLLTDASRKRLGNFYEGGSPEWKDN